MTRARTVIALLLLSGAFFAPSLIGQQPASQNAPRLGYVYPAGGRQGTTVRVVVGGQFLNGAFEGLISERDVHLSVVNVDRPLTAQQITALRDQLQALQPRAGDPAVRQQIASLRTRLGDSLQRNRNPVLADRVTLDVEIEANAAPGLRHIRLRTPAGLSNPLVFAVGQLPEVKERDVKNSRADAELPVTLPITANGRLIPGDVDNARQPLRQPAQYMPGDVDRYRFAAKAGQKIVVRVAARELMPYLADTVPGWFQAVATMYDADGREVAFCDDYRFKPDPVLHYEIPADGDYVVEVRDAIYRGREDFVYRVSIGEMPFITHIFPLGAAVGSRTQIEVAGWNLPAGATTLSADGEPRAYLVSMKAGAIESNRLPFVTGSLPERLEAEPNDARASAQALDLPVVINGRIGSADDRDVFSFNGRAGDVIVADVMARRLESPLDSAIELTDARGQVVARADDREDKTAGLLTHQADAYLLATLPADGTYYVHLSDAQGKSGPEYGYRLRLSAPQPDFELDVTPSTINAAKGATIPVTATVVRRDGFDGEIQLSLKDAPAGFVLSGAVIPPGIDRVTFTMTAPGVATNGPDRVRLEGRATVLGRTVVHEAVPADERQQAFAYRHLVPTDQWRVFVSGRGGTRVPIRVLGPLPIRIAAGGTARVRIALPAAYQAFEHLQFDLNEPPPGITIGAAVAASPGGNASFELRADTKAPVGLRSNLIVLMSGERVSAPNTQGQPSRRRVPMGALPAIPFEIIR